MIEKKSAVEQLEDILSVDGIDMIQWGPADYSMSIGQPGNRGSHNIREVERQVIKASMKAGIPARAEIGSVDVRSPSRRAEENGEGEIPSTER